MKTELRIPFYLTWKHLIRGNKWTLLLIIFLMAVAFINLIFVTSLFNGIIDNTNKQIINTSTGHIFITPKEGSDYIENVDQVLAVIKKTEGVVAASGQMTVPASLKYKNIKGNWQILAINPDDEKNVTNVSQKMIEGSYLSANDTDQIIIGRQIAGGEGVEDNAFSFKGAKVGEKVTLSFDSVSRDFNIKGIFYTNFQDTDGRAFITQKALTQMIPTLDNEATNIVVRLVKTGIENATIAKLEAAGIDANIYSWQEAAGLMTSITKSFLSINVIMSFVAILIAAVTIFIVIYIDISNKKKQIGILRAIGVKPYIIVSSYLIQTAVYSVAGVLLGTGLFYAAIVPYFIAHPFALPIGDASLLVNFPDFIARAESIIWVAILAGLIPAIIITRIKILDALRER
jgi:putative ABC transport system permease protein